MRPPYVFRRASAVDFSRIDESWLLLASPHSYTTDDIVEISRTDRVVLRHMLNWLSLAARVWPSRASSRCGRF